ncbi:UDP-N-acetylmuramate--L-alanine ligase [Clostridiisalibacter paucivorans]|uniref:UDP-N-acetylmuramate--L-alanine ligase n=1 Tax=Clostridiisalibacter paucivorans TaxID=408753 RepID=UPI000553F8AD|nr:UDP-N-acetylmuramate--L-alanine ligase [Clostridiisalibacter paucivorans]
MFEFDINKHDFNHVHFIGIGGVSMSGLAEIMIKNDYTVSGSDIRESKITNKLKNLGVEIFIGHNESNISEADLVVYTSALSDDNCELVSAKNHDILYVDRATFLGQLMRKYKKSIAVSGTHGKTTTTGMIATILEKSLSDPTVLIGGDLDIIGGNVKIGNGNYFLTEACEYKSNFLKFFPDIGVVLNVDADHLDYFRDIDHIVETFNDFAKLVPNDGFLIVNSDDSNMSSFTKENYPNLVTFSISDSQTDYFADNIGFDQLGFPNFTLNVGSQSHDVSLRVVGKHNISNALAAIAACHKSGISLEDAIQGIKFFTGTHRRFETKGLIRNIKVIDDYAHHPTEIKATLSAAKTVPHNKLWCVFQPHTYTRTKALLDDFSNSFSDANKIIITDIYAAREKDEHIVHSTDLKNKLMDKGIDAIYIRDFEDIVNYLNENLKSNDMLITMGAGNVYEIGEMLLEKK